MSVVQDDTIGGASETLANTVLFARYLNTDAGDFVLICGSPDWLGAWDVQGGVPCTCVADDVGLKWSASVSASQKSFEYKYVRKFADGRCEWEQGPNRIACLGTTQNPLQDDTQIEVRFKIHYATSVCKNLAVCGSPVVLGAWKLVDALKLEWTENHMWQTNVSLPSHFLETPFSFKYAVVSEGSDANGEVLWETRTDRWTNLSMLEPTNGVYELWNAWDATLVVMSIFNSTEPFEVMAVCGGHDHFGNWKRPRVMSLGRERMLRTNVKGVCWEVAFPVNVSAKVAYRYVIVPTEGGTAVWEREPNRFVEFPAMETAPNGIFDWHDVNFVGGMQFDFVPPCLFVGPYPQTIEHIDKLTEAGVGGVMNLQTQEDFDQRQIDWKALQQHYDYKHVDARHFPIKDFSGDDLARKLCEGADQVHQMVCEGKKVFIHCTAGMGRAPALAVVYLCRHQGYQFDHAHSHVRAHRTVATPNVGAMRQALGI